MTKTLLLVVFSVLVYCVPSNAQPFSLDAVRADAMPAAEAPLPAVLPQVPVPPKEWTVMYYSSTKDVKLRVGLLTQLLLMKNAGANANVNVIVQTPVVTEDAAGAVSTSTVRLAIGEPWDMAKVQAVGRAALTKNAYINPAFLEAYGTDVIAHAQGVDGGDWRQAAAFFKWAKANYPARHYALLIYGHGNGFFDEEKPAQKSTLKDEDTGNYVSVPEMRLMMAEAGKVDIFIMQSCLMQTAEVAWQLKDHADVIVGSEELLWSVGYPVSDMIRVLGEGQEVRLPELGAMLAEGYVGVVKSRGLTGHSSVLLTARLDGFAARLNAWVSAVMALKDRALLSPALLQVMRYDIFGWTQNPESAPYAKNVSHSGDICDLVKIVDELLPAELPGAAEVRARGAELTAYLSGELVYKHSYTGKNASGFDYSRAGGLAAHMPNVKFVNPQAPVANSRSPKLYWNLPFVKETKWGEFLHWMYGHNVAAR